MAKEKRFPSPANVAVDKKGLPVAPKVQAPMPEKKVEGKPVDLVKVHYKGKNNHILHTAAHALAPGLNHVPREVMKAEVENHPAVAQMVEKGLVSIDWDHDEAREAPSVEEPPAEESDNG